MSTNAVHEHAGRANTTALGDMNGRAVNARNILSGARYGQGKIAQNANSRNVTAANGRRKNEKADYIFNTATPGPETW